MIKLRAPAVPLITVDPYFSVWSPSDRLNFEKTVHWTGKENNIKGYVMVDGVKYLFMGEDVHAKKIKQTLLAIDALSTKYIFETDTVKLRLRFMTPLLMDDLSVMTRPVSYLGVSYESKDEEHHKVEIIITADTTLCLDHANENECTVEEMNIGNIHIVKMGNSKQDVLYKSGDDVRINWGYFYFACVGNASSVIKKGSDVSEGRSVLQEKKETLFIFAYDDISSINYFGTPLKSYWNKDGKTIEQVISEAVYDYEIVKLKCDNFASALYNNAKDAGGEEYADIVSLAYRQAVAAHKVAVNKNGEILYISKECFSNGCAATVDVSYPSFPLFLLYNTELAKGMLRPIYKFACSKDWKFDFAPHDAGRYPHVMGQVYGKNEKTGELEYRYQMPVEECGNMIIMETSIALAEGNPSFAMSHIALLTKWCEYLINYGDDPDNQLCTDDFAGHLAHNCNLSIKAIMGIMGMGIIYEMAGDKKTAAKYKKLAKEKAKSWEERARNNDGSYRLAFDLENSYSLKYNLVWDRVWNTDIFHDRVAANEIKTNLRRFNEYGIPLDSRADYTKADWIVWTATLAKNKNEFRKYIYPLWKAYNESPSRVPLTDWYDTFSAKHIFFVNRTVVGGFFIKLLEASGKMKRK
ncbi:MAG: DUF4965 domain-containing protein [Clostridia bacterium]|nr:DUF4965 domain-containing protein [Clostridia bacterium]